MDYLNNLNPIVYEFDHGKFENIDVPAGLQLGFSTTEMLTVLPTVVHNENKWHTTGKNSPRALEIRSRP